MAKKVVRVESTEPDQPKPSKKTSRKAGQDGSPAAGWQPTAEAAGEAKKLRLIAAGLWVLAVAGEIYAIVGLLREDQINFVLLCILIVVIGALAIGGSLLWKKANRLDPASRSEPVKFFIQNQLGAIISVLAFLPLIVLILLDKDLDGRQKTIAGVLGVVVMGLATYLGADFDPPSTEQYAEEQSEVIAITGQDLVFWTKSGEVFHLCEDVSAVNLDSADNTIYSGTVADAHAAGKDRLTKQVDLEKRQCGFTDADVPADEATETPAEEPSESPN